MYTTKGVLRGRLVERFDQENAGRASSVNDCISEKQDSPEHIQRENSTGGFEILVQLVPTDTFK